MTRIQFLVVGSISMLLLSYRVDKSVVLLTADGSKDTYDLINQSLAPINGNVVEVSDCSHGDFGAHITQQFDNKLNKDVFVFHAHVNYDNDRCTKFDRQRTEIKTYEQSGKELVGTQGETHEYKWLFKIAKDFKPSTGFTHIHQIKAIGGDDSMPILTFTARSKKKVEMFEVRYSHNAGQETIKEIDLDLIKGEWIVAQETITYGENGNLKLKIVRKRDNKVLLELEESLVMWKDDARVVRPKWGIYRSLNKKEMLQDEQVLFADFELTEF